MSALLSLWFLLRCSSCASNFCSCAHFLFIAEAFLCVSDSALQCFLTLCKFFFLKLLLSRRRGFLPLCVNIIVVSAFNTRASSFWFWHGRCNCFASCRVSAPRFLAVSFFFVATFLFLHYLLSHLHPAQAKGLLVLLLMCHFFHQILPLNFLS